MFQFKDLIHTGMESAGKVEVNQKSINDLFALLNTELSEETDNLFTISRYRNGVNITDPRNMAAGGLTSTHAPVIQPDTGTLNIVLNNGDNAAIARWQQHPDGYPFTIEFSGERTDCWDQEALGLELGRIVSSGQLWLKARELQAGALQKQKQNDADE